MTLLPGRDVECARLEQLLEAARAGRSAALVLRGESGIGKTTLLQYVAERADAVRLLRAAGVESEMELPFAGLRQLCEPLLGRLEELPLPQREALGTAFGLTSFRRPDRFLVALSVLSLLSDAAEEGSLVCLVDDAHWLDRSSAQVLAFVARRLQEESVLVLFAEREGSESDALAGLPALPIAALSDSVARELLRSVIKGPLDAQVREQILVEAHGNPLALLELPNERSPADLAGGFGLAAEPPVRDRIESSFRRRVGELPVETQQLLLVAAAEPTGDSALLWRALARLGVPPESAVPAEAEGLLEFGARILFRHPLLRSAVYGAASEEERRVAHGALAAATDVELDPDRRAWHRAWATLVVDEDVAAELERSAVRAYARGGLPAAAAFLERAAALTPEIGERARRVLAAAEAKLLAGAPQTALSLLATVAVGPLAERDGATLQRYRGQIALDLRHGGEATELLLDAARRLEPFDPDLARETYTDALRAASISGRLGDSTLDAAEAARGAPAPSGAQRAVDLLLDSLAVRFTDGYVPSVPSLKEALRAVLDEETRGVEDVRWPWSARRVAPDLFDDETWRTFALRNVQRARDQGALAVLPLALHYLAQYRVFEGNLDAATALVDEADGVSDAVGGERIEIGSVLIAGCRGDEARGLQTLEDSRRTALVRGEGVLLTFGEHARAVLFNGLGRYDEALTPAVNAYALDELCASTWSMAEAVEAAARCGREELAAEALERLAERTRAAGSEWALGVEARSRAVLDDGPRADELYREAIDRLGRCRIAFDRARAHLLYGEWLRRERRRVDAREQLRTAHDMFTQMGAEAFAGRAARELRATGETMQRREAGTRDELTAQEGQIAWLARDGLSNPEIAAQLFISPRTVEYHLHKVFAKLAIRRRSQLGRALGEAR